jgi:transcriptional regulatory protein RtcR
MVVFDMVGTTLDHSQADHSQADDPKRWERWQPSVDLCRHQDLRIDRFELLHAPTCAAVAAQVAADIATFSPGTEVRLHPIDIADTWDFEAIYGALHDFATAYPFVPDEEEYLVHVTTGTDVVQICLCLLTQSRHLPARLIQTSPPPQPLGQRSEEPGRFAIIDLDLAKNNRLASRVSREQRAGLSLLKSGIDTLSARFNHLIERIEQVALSSRAPILLVGPAGAGKSRLARRIFELKKARRQISGQLVALNCATLRGDAAMSALFGHRQGAFTGALQDRDGLLRSADRGVLFLDEIGELGADEQAMLLGALEHKTFLPLGADREARSDFQLIAGTNRDLFAAARQGRFRDDLLARINLWTFELPGLVDRREDLAANLEYELAEHARLEGRRVSFTADARARFLEFAVSPAARWVGNFRDFNAAIVRMATLAHGGRITPESVDEEIARLLHAWSGASEVPESLVTRLLGAERAAELDRFARVQLEDVLRVCSDCQTLSEAGRRLFSVSREAKRTSNDADRLRKYLARFGLEWQPVRAMLARD